MAEAENQRGLQEGDQPVVKWAPVFLHERTGHDIIFAHKNHLGNTEDEAKQIGVGMMFIEGVMTGSRNTWRVVKLEKGASFPHIEAKLGVWDVLVIAGPELDKAMKEAR